MSPSSNKGKGLATGVPAERPLAHSFSQNEPALRILAEEYFALEATLVDKPEARLAWRSHAQEL